MNMRTKLRWPARLKEDKIMSRFEQPGRDDDPPREIAQRTTAEKVLRVAAFVALTVGGVGWLLQSGKQPESNPASDQTTSGPAE